MTPPESTAEWLKESTWVHASVILSVIVLMILLIVSINCIRANHADDQVLHWEK